MFIPITLLNFKYMILAKILADRLAPLMPFLVSKEHMGFIKGKNILDCTFLASESINVLDNNHKHGNLFLKVDIAKAFDTISWHFLISVLAKFGFYQKLCDWIHILLSSACLSINFNGQQQGYFK